MKPVWQTRIFFLCAGVFFIGLFFTQYGIHSVILNVLSLLSFAGLFIILTARSFLLGFFINIVFLLILPFLLIQNDTIFLDTVNTNTTLFIISYIFALTIIDFFIMTYKAPLNSPVPMLPKFIPRKSLFYKSLIQFIRWIFQTQTFFKMLAVFIQYLFLLYSVIFTFALLYAYLGNVFHEGIEAEHITVQNWDALYFSVTTFFTIGFGDITPNKYSGLTKTMVIIQAIIGHLITAVLWPIVIIFAFDRKKN